MNEGQLYTDRVPDGHKAFHTTLHLVTKQGCKLIPIQVNPGIDVNNHPMLIQDPLPQPIHSKWKLEAPQP